MFSRLLIQNSNEKAIDFNSINDLKILKDIKDSFKDNIKNLVRYHADLKGKIYNADFSDYITFYWYDDPQVNSKVITDMIEEMERIINEKEQNR